MIELFDSTRDLSQDVFRNIISLRISEDLFDDLTNGNESLSIIAREAEMRVKRDAAPGIISRGFHYSTAIEYPFNTDNFMETRYADGSHPAWYGSLSLITTIYETAYHMARRESGVEGIESPLIQERLVYEVHCSAILINLIGKETTYPQLISNEYSFTRSIGKRLFNEGHPGLLAPSARHNDGVNIVSFRASTLSNPRQHCYLTYTLHPSDWSITVERTPGEELMTVSAEQWL